jgi:hypothetical protein
MKGEKSAPFMLMFIFTFGEKGNGDAGTDDSFPPFFELKIGDDAKNPGEVPYGNGECRGAMSKSFVFDVGLRVGLGPHMIS